MKLETLLFGDYSKRALKKIDSAVCEVEALADTYRSMSDEELAGVTGILRGRLENGETTEQILPDAFAAVREAADRVLGKRPFRVQIIGGILLHQGRIAEMKTGEGKTLVATMPAYLNALTGKGVHIVTVNDYLAQRDAEEMGRVYGFLGLTTGVILNSMQLSEKQEQYRADITYGTNTEFGFDYLRDNIAKDRRQLLQRGHNFCIIDEVDSILIDEARTPLIISGVGDKTSDIYEKCDTCTRRLHAKVIKELDSKQEIDEENCDYIVDEKHATAVLTPRGEKKVEEFFGIENLNDVENSDIAHNMNQAIHAHGVKKKDVDYVIVDGEVVIVDPFTGRLMQGRRYQDGLHQAIEAKEKVNVKGESRVIATVTIQNYFRMYSKLSGMTGTAKTEESEFREIYGLDVVEVPTNKPMIRVDNHDRIFNDEKHKFAAIVEKVKECNGRGQPVLIGTASVEKSEQLAKLLKAAGIRFNMLNAKDHAREALVIAEAGMPGSVTLATNMAGRGTDIMLGGNPEMMARAEMKKDGRFTNEQISLSVCNYRSDDPVQLEANALYRELYDKFKVSMDKQKQAVIDAGGLCIIGSERHESRRIDNQLRGRSGRQGDPGESTFYVSLTDDIMRLFGDERMKRFAALSANMVSDGDSGDLSAYLKILADVIEKAQKNVEGTNFKRRKTVLQYDDVLNEQRKEIYSQRAEIIQEGDVSEKIRGMIPSAVADSVDSAIVPSDNGKTQVIDADALMRKYQGWGVNEGELDFAVGADAGKVRDKVAGIISENALKLYEKREEELTPELFHAFERYVLLEDIDSLWLDHIDNMEDLETNVMLQSYASRDPLNVYRITGGQMFLEMINEIRQNTVRKVLTERVAVKERPQTQAPRNLSFGRQADGPAKKPGMPAPNLGGKPQPVRNTSPKVGPNDPCPCGSGKKYKKCCGAGGGSEE